MCFHFLNNEPNITGISLKYHVVPERDDKNVLATLCLGKEVIKIFGDHVVRKGGDEKCFSGYVVMRKRNEKRFCEHVVRKSGEGRLA
jgi:hypothetical protein